MNLSKYQVLILIMNHLTPNEILYKLLTKMKKNTFTHHQHYIVEQKQTQQFFDTVGVSNEAQHLYHLHEPRIAGIYSLLNDRMIQDITLPAINKAFVHNVKQPHH